MENPRGSEFHRQRLALPGELENLISSVRADGMTLIVVGGCETGWSEKTTARLVSKVANESNARIVSQAMNGMEAQHNSECSSHHDVIIIPTIVSPGHKAFAKKTANSLVTVLNNNTGFKT